MNPDYTPNEAFWAPSLHEMITTPSVHAVIVLPPRLTGNMWPDTPPRAAYHKQGFGQRNVLDSTYLCLKIDTSI